MNTKQTPEQYALDALRAYEGLDDSFVYGTGLSAKHMAARQTIIKAFQDRAELLASIKELLRVCISRGTMLNLSNEGPVLDSARAIILKAKS